MCRWGYSWRIEIKKIGEDYYFDNGWTNVVKDANFMFGDHVLFTLVDDNYKFKMFVYGKNSCERSLPKKVKVVEDDGNNDVYEGESSKTKVVKKKRGRELHSCERSLPKKVKVVEDIAANVDVDGDEGEEDYEEKDGVDMDGNPYFKLTIPNGYKSHLRFPANFVRLARIEAAGTITLMNLDGKESSMSLRLKKNSQKTYYISLGWAGFRRSNKIAIGDECVFKYITSESKLCLAKVTKKKKSARQPQPSAKLMRTDYVKRKRGQSLHEHGRDMDVESEDECMEVMKRLRGNDDVDGDDPFFILTLSKTHRTNLRLPEKFVELSGIHADETIKLKNNKGEEWQIGVLLDTLYHTSERYIFSAGWLDFQQSNDLSFGDECIIKFIRKEGKFCLAKVTKKQKQAWKPQPSGQILATKDVKRKRGLPPHEQGGDVDVESEDDCVELVKRPRGKDDNDDDNYEDKDNNINDDDNLNHNDGEDEADGGGGGDIDGDPFSASIISRPHTLRLPGEFVGYPGRQPLPSGEILATTEVVKRNRGQPVLEDLGDVDVKNEDERVEVVKRLCGEDHDVENDCQHDGLDNGVNNGKDNDNDGDDNKHGDVSHPTFDVSEHEVPVLVEVKEGNAGPMENGGPGEHLTGLQWVEVEQVPKTRNSGQKAVLNGSAGVIELSDDEEETQKQDDQVEAQKQDNQEETLKQDNEYDFSCKKWFYRDPYGQIQGPVSRTELKVWSDEGYFYPDFKVWKDGQTPDDAILLTDMLSGNCSKC